MNQPRGIRGLCALVTYAICAQAQATPACDLQIRDGWVRLAPPGTMMRAGYATLANGGDRPIRIDAVRSAQFGDVGMHETVEENGLSKMRPIDALSVPAHGAVAFAPGGRHFMLMRPVRNVGSDTIVDLVLHTDCGDIAAQLPVRQDAP